MKKDILIDFLDEHIEFKTSFDELRDEIIIPTVQQPKKSVLWLKIFIPVIACLVVVVLSIELSRNFDRSNELNPSDSSAPPVENSFSGLAPYEGDAHRILKRQYELSQEVKKQTILDYLEEDNTIYELSYHNGIIPDSFIIVYMPIEEYNALKNRKMDGSIINDLISKNNSLNELKWFSSTTNRGIEVIQSSYHLAAIYAVGKVQIFNSDQQIVNQLSYLKPLNISLGTQIVQLEDISMNLLNHWFMIHTSTDVTAWKGYLENYVTSNMLIAKIQNSIVEFDYDDDQITDEGPNDFINYLGTFQIAPTKYHYEGLLKYIENYKER